MSERDQEPRVNVGPGFEEEWSGASALASNCILNLLALNEQLLMFGQALVLKHGIPSMAAFNVLTILHGAAEPLSPSTIAERMVVSRPTMTGIIQSLARRGFIRRHPHAEDRRMVLVEITWSGRDRVQALRPELHRAERQWMGCLTEPEQRALLHLLARLQANSQTL